MVHSVAARSPDQNGRRLPLAMVTGRCVLRRDVVQVRFARLAGRPKVARAGIVRHRAVHDWRHRTGQLGRRLVVAKGLLVVSEVARRAVLVRLPLAPAPKGAGPNPVLGALRLAMAWRVVAAAHGNSEVDARARNVAPGSPAPVLRLRAQWDC